MTDDERELLKTVCGVLGTLTNTLANGGGRMEMEDIDRMTQESIGLLFHRVFTSDTKEPVR